MSVADERGSSSRATSRGRSSSKPASGGKRQAQARSRARTQGTNGDRSTGRQSAPKRSTSGRSQGASAGRSQGTGTAARKPRAAGARKPRAAAARKATETAEAASTAQSNGRGSSRGGFASIAAPAVTGAIGIAGGVLLGRKALQRNKKVLGVSLPTKVDLAGVSQQLGEAGRQFSKLAGEVRSVREKAEQIGRVLG